MSSDVLARVEAFRTKAKALCEKGHLLRAAENFGRAAEAAQPLGADNLVSLHLQLRRGNMLLVYAMAPEATADPHILAAHRAQCIALYSGAVAALERRRVAGTLLDRKCTAAEKAWRANDLRRNARDCPAAEAASVAEFVGYEEFLRAATYVLSNVLAHADRFDAAECSTALQLSFTQHAVRAGALMQQPRRYVRCAIDSEATFTNALRNAVADGGDFGLDVRLVQPLAAAWERLQRSGVLQTRRIEARITEMTPGHFTRYAALQSSLTAPGLRTCTLDGCGAREAHPAHFKSCAACRTVVYCCREHQVEGWPAHKAACKAARKAAASAEDDGAGPSGA